MRNLIKAAVGSTLLLALAACDQSGPSGPAPDAERDAARSSTSDAMNGTREMTDGAVDAIKAAAGSSVEEAKQAAKSYASQAVNEGKRAAADAMAGTDQVVVEKVMDGDVDAEVLEKAADQAKKKLGDWKP